MDASLKSNNKLQSADSHVIDLYIDPARVSDVATPVAVSESKQTGDMWTFEEAIRKLGITRRTAFRKLKKGELTGYKLEGPYGPEWRIYPVELTGDSGECHVTTPVIPEVNTQYLIEQLQAKLEGATYRIGYLESKLEERDSQIKLLTDSQHKTGWWDRFSSWLKAQ
jgi:hypothetical protein